MSIWRFADLFTDTPERFRITLGEGDTPLLRSRRIGPEAGLERLYFKLETVNPTGSYKDRFAAAAIADMLAHGRTLAIGTSSGNTGSAVAAYCAAANVRCELAIVEPAPDAKLKQMQAYGADIYKVRGFGLDEQVTAAVFDHLHARGRSGDAQVQISAFAISPKGMAGVQTISYELAEQFADGIDHVFVPAGGGGLTLAIALGFDVLRQRKRIAFSPRIECVQPVGNDTIATPLSRGEDRARAVRCTTAIGGLQVPSVIDGDAVIAACHATGGTGHTVSDEDVWATQARLAREEGVFCEPAGAVAVTAALAAARAGRIDPAARIVCLVTGSGFKDQAALDRMVPATCPIISLDDLKSR